MSSSEGLGEYPKNVDVPALGDRRLAFTARLLAVVCSASLMVNLALAGLLMVLLPLKEVKPFLVNFADEDGVVATIRPLDRQLDGIQVLFESLAAEYVVMRHSVVESEWEMRRRWTSDNSYIIAHSAEPVATRHFREISQYFGEMRENGWTRRVEIESVRAVVEGRNYLIDFTLVTLDENGEELRRRALQARADVGLVGRQVEIENRLINPLGFRVFSYELQERNTE